MNITDPREKYDDLLVTRSQEVLEPEEFREAVTSEVATVGWLVLAFVFDDRGRVLLIDQSGTKGWMVPGGALKPEESPSEAVVREIQEETGVTISPIRPHAIDEFTFVNERTDETGRWTTVFFEATAEMTELKADLGLEGEEIKDADWFSRLPDDLFRREWTEKVYRRCSSNRTTR